MEQLKRVKNKGIQNSTWVYLLSSHTINEKVKDKLGDKYDYA